MVDVGAAASATAAATTTATAAAADTAAAATAAAAATTAAAAAAAAAATTTTSNTTGNRHNRNRFELFGALTNETLQVAPGANTVQTLSISKKMGERLGQSFHVAARTVRRVDADSVMATYVDEFVSRKRHHALAQVV